MGENVEGLAVPALLQQRVAQREQEMLVLGSQFEGPAKMVFPFSLT